MSDMKNLRKSIEHVVVSISDARCPCDIKIPLIDVISIAVISLLCGYDNIEDMHLMATMRKDFLEKSFHIKTIPSEATLRRVLSLIKPQELFTASLAYLRSLLPEAGDHLARDGKAIRSVEKSDKAGAFRILSIYDSGNSLTISQGEVGDKTNEIPVLQELLSVLELDGRIITADAMHCQKETCQAVLKAKGDYIFQVKANQKGLLEQASSLLQLAIRSKDPALTISETSERSRGRDEFRTTYLLPVLKEDDIAEAWPGISRYAAVYRKTVVKGKESEEWSYYISSLVGTATHVGDLIRRHWQVEAMHWALDVIFHEDETRIRNQQLLLNLNILRKLALALHKQYIHRLIAASEKKTKRYSLTGSMKKCLLSQEYLLEVIACSPLEEVKEGSEKNK